jgi:hypothetical protein
MNQYFDCNEEDRHRVVLGCLRDLPTLLRIVAKEPVRTGWMLEAKHLHTIPTEINHKQQKCVQESLSDHYQYVLFNNKGSMMTTITSQKQWFPVPGSWLFLPAPVLPTHTQNSHCQPQRLSFITHTIFQLQTKRWWKRKSKQMRRLV